MKRGGRPPTRNRFALMLSVWRVVKQEVAVKGAPSVREACRRICNGRKRINVLGPDGSLIDAIVDDEQLRQRFQAAERARKEVLAAGERGEAWHRWRIETERIERLVRVAQAKTLRR